MATLGGALTSMSGDLVLAAFGALDIRYRPPQAGYRLECRREPDLTLGADVLRHFR